MHPDHCTTGALAPLYEYTWNHTTLYAIKALPETTYLQVRFPAGRELDVLDTLAAAFGDEVIFHLEFQRRFGRIFVSSPPLVRFTTLERLILLSLSKRRAQRWRDGLYGSESTRSYTAIDSF